MRRVLSPPPSVELPLLVDALEAVTSGMGMVAPGPRASGLTERAYTAVENAAIASPAVVFGLLASRRLGAPRRRGAWRRGRGHRRSPPGPSRSRGRRWGVDAPDIPTRLRHRLFAGNDRVRSGADVLSAGQIVLDADECAEADVIGCHRSMFGPTESADPTGYRNLRAASARGHQMTGPFERQAKAGRTIVPQGTCGPILDSAGDVVRAIEAASDVTEAGTALRGSDWGTRAQAERATAIGSPRGMIAFETEGNLLGADSRPLDLAGYGEGEVGGRRQSISVKKALADTDTSRRVWQPRAAGRPMRGTSKRVAREGRTIALRGSHGPVHEEADEVAPVVEVAFDIADGGTERPALEERTSERAANVAAIGCSQAIAEVDGVGGIQEANGKSLGLTDYAAQGIIGRPRAISAGGDAAPGEHEDIRRALGEGEPATGTSGRVTTSGRALQLPGSDDAVRDRGGRVRLVVGMAADIGAVESERLEGLASRRAIEAEFSQVVDSLPSGLANLAEGGPSTRIADGSGADLDTRCANLDAATGQHERTLSSVLVDAASIGGEASQVAAAADARAQRTEDRAAPFEATAAALGGLVIRVEATTDAPETASDDVARTEEEAVKGGRVVERAVGATTGIEKPSRRIVGIIRVLEVIAVRTDVVALEAGVETARTRDAGRGLARRGLEGAGSSHPVLGCVQGGRGARPDVLAAGRDGPGSGRGNGSGAGDHRRVGPCHEDARRWDRRIGADEVRRDRKDGRGHRPSRSGDPAGRRDARGTLRREPCVACGCGAPRRSRIAGPDDGSSRRGRRAHVAQSGGRPGDGHRRNDPARGLGGQTRAQGRRRGARGWASGPAGIPSDAASPARDP